VVGVDPDYGPASALGDLPKRLFLILQVLMTGRGSKVDCDVPAQ